MGLQNRVDPYGRLIITTARGQWMGNRGLLHDQDQHVRHAWRLKRWLICVLEFKSRRRAVMSPGLYTELFFLDEATALAAGQRPCAECRRPHYDRFRAAAETNAGPFKRAIDLDERLHADRVAETGGQRTFWAPIAALPDGVFIRFEQDAWLIRRGARHRWTPFGYDLSARLPRGDVEVMTPHLTVGAIAAGYEPQINLLEDCDGYWP